jgi:hypothetical protein
MLHAPMLAVQDFAEQCGRDAERVLCDPHRVHHACVLIIYPRPRCATRYRLVLYQFGWDRVRPQSLSGHSESGALCFIENQAIQSSKAAHEKTEYACKALFIVATVVGS